MKVYKHKTEANIFVVVPTSGPHYWYIDGEVIESDGVWKSVPKDLELIAEYK